MHLNEHRVNSLSAAAVMADEFILTHKVMYETSIHEKKLKEERIYIFLCNCECTRFIGFPNKSKLPANGEVITKCFENHFKPCVW